MILLWGLMEDGPVAAVCRRLEEMRAPFAFVDQRRVAEYVLELNSTGRATGKMLGPDCDLDLAQVTSIYVRPYSFADLDVFDGVSQTSPAWQCAARFEEAMLTWCELTDAVVVNPPSRMGSNSSKPFQLETIRHAGFRVPETLITTDPEALADFSHAHGQVIYKSISSWRSIVARLSTPDFDRMQDLECCPTQFQAFVDGTDYRVHVLNDLVFAHRIDCPDDDYRYSERARITSVELTPTLEERCVTLTRRLGLVFAGIDLRQSVDGDWYCFEVNPSPGFTFFDQGAIGLELARHLAASN